LGLELVNTGKTLRLLVPGTEQFLLTTREVAEAHRNAEAKAAAEAARASAEAARAERAEREVQRLRAELVRLQKSQLPKASRKPRRK
jgi:hypothetical protein